MIKHHESLVTKNPWLRIVPVNPAEDDNELADCVIRDLFHRRNFQIDLKLVDFIFSIVSPQSSEQIKQNLINQSLIDIVNADEAVSFFLQNELLIETSHAANELFQRTEFWMNYSWGSAQEYNAATYNFDYLTGTFDDRSKDKELMKQYLEVSSPPSHYKEVHSQNIISLPDYSDEIKSYDLASTLLPEPNAKNEGKPFSQEDLSALCFFPFGRTGSISFHNQGDFLLKCVPSGGARHPVECSLFSFGNDVPDGLYQYDVKNHALGSLNKKVSLDELKKVIYEIGIKVGFEPKVILVLSLMFERSYWRYKEARSYRVIHNDVGHVLEAIGMTTIALSRKYYIGHGFYDDELNKLCGFDKGESSVYFVAIG